MSITYYNYSSAKYTLKLFLWTFWRRYCWNNISWPLCLIMNSSKLLTNTRDTCSKRRSINDNNRHLIINMNFFWSRPCAARSLLLPYTCWSAGRCQPCDGSPILLDFHLFSWLFRACLDLIRSAESETNSQMSSASLCLFWNDFI